MSIGRYVRLTASVLTVVALVTSASAADAALRAPRQQNPANGATLQALPAFTWGGVGGAARYQFEFSADRKFTSAVNGFGQGEITIVGTAMTNDKAIPNGTYYWRVRGVTAKDRLGRWSPTRVLHKEWNTDPTLTSPIDGTTVTWPTSPLVLHWNPIRYATQYDVWIATDPALSNLVLGSVNQPVTTQGTVLAFPTTLAPGRYYWAITPVDAENFTGPRSVVSSFTWTWPSATTPVETNVATDPAVVDPQFTWSPVAGAASYQVQVNTSSDFPAGSQFCCTTAPTGTTLNPTQLLPNAKTLYWRMRAIDVRGDAGQWNVGQPFEEAFDQLNPTVPNLTLRDINGNPLAPGSPTQTPIVTWSPVPGASSYELQLTPYQPAGCDYTLSPRYDISTATTAWTPFAKGQHEGPQAWPNPEGGTGPNPGADYCLRVLARRDDGAPGGGGQVISDWTSLGGTNGDAFGYTPTTPSGTLEPTPASAYISPAPAGVNPMVTSTPLFTWNPVPGAAGYYVIIARDQCFTDVVDVGFTDVSAYAPRIANQAPFEDEVQSYYWAVVPAGTADGHGVFSDPECTAGSADNPQAFTKESIPPTPLTPINGQNAATDPTLKWTNAQGERNYTLQIASDPSFANPLTQVNTDSASYTAEDTLPADTVLYWRVRANDVAGQGLNWSPTATFTHTLSVPTPLASNAAAGESIPAFAWTSVMGAVSYTMHVDQADGTKRNFTVDSPVLSPTFWWGTGIWRWQVQANFPGGVSSAFFSPESAYVRVEKPPTGVIATKSGLRIVIRWNPDTNAKRYRVQLSTTQGFSRTIDSDSTDDTVWAPQITAGDAKRTLYWRLAAIDQGSNVGAYTSGVFNAPKRSKPHTACKRTKKHPRCAKQKKKHG
jgi:hypothetical protein